MTAGADVLVVGGGVIGLGIAWRAASRDLQVMVADPQPGAGASRAAAGMIAPVTEVHYGEVPLLRLSLESARRWATFASELEAAAGRPVGYRTDGTLAVAFDADDNRALEDLYAYQRELGLEVDRLRSRECRDLEPALSPRVRGGIHVAGDHQVDNRAVTAALLDACRSAGVEVRRVAVERLTVTANRAGGAELGNGERIEATTTVLATGCWSARVPGLPAEVVPPVRPVKGQILRFRGDPTAPLIARPVRALVEGHPIYLVPREGGEVVVGATVEEKGFDTTVTAEAVYELLRGAIELVPGVRDLELVEATAGLRPGTPDNAPLLGPSALEGLVVATGHYRHGFLLLPVTADGIAELLATGRVPGELVPFSPLRFAGEGAAATGGLR